MARDTLLHFFHDFADLPDQFLIYDDGFRSHHYRYNEVAAKAQAFAGRLRDAGFAKDDKLILYGENRPEWIIALWGCLIEGVIVVPIDYRSSADFVQRIDQIVQARAILIGDEASLPESTRIWKLSSLNDDHPAVLCPRQ
jgi:long-chain acyl-CoA synthetase